MLVFIVAGRGLRCMENNPKKSKKVLIIISFTVVITLVTAAALIYVITKGTTPKGDNANKKVLDQMNKTQVAPSGLNPSDLTRANALIIAGKDIEAKRILDNLKTASGLQTYDRLNIYSSLSGICTRLKNIECMKEVIAFNKENNRVDIYLIIDVARLEKTNSPEEAKDYFSQAKKIIEDNGGQVYVKKLNASNEITIDYDEVINGSR